MAKNHLITASEYAEDRSAIERDRSIRMPAIHMIYKAYEEMSPSKCNGF